MSEGNEPRQSRAHRILAVIWMAESCCLLAWMVAGLIQVLFGSRQHTPPGTLPFIGVVTLFATCGIIGSAFLFRGSGWGRRTVRLVALLTTVVALWQIRLDIPLWLGGRLFIEREMLIFAGVALFSLATIMLLHPLRNRDPDPKPVT